MLLVLEKIFLKVIRICISLLQHIVCKNKVWGKTTQHPPLVDPIIVVPGRTVVYSRAPAALIFRSLKQEKGHDFYISVEPLLHLR